MPLDPDEFAEMVVQAVDTALGPVLERLAGIDARLSTIGDLRDRVVTVETKAAMPAAPDGSLGELRDRVLVLETKAAIPSVPVLPLPPEAGFDDLRDRIVTLEAKTATPVNVEALVAPVLERLAVMDVRMERIALTEAALTELGKETVSLRERAAVLETKAPVPGPSGQDGANGRDGADGLGFDDLVVVPAGERGVTVRAMRGEQAKDIGTVTFAVDLYRGVWLEGKGYEQGDSVTWAGSEWHCNESTLTKPGDGSKAWTLKVKRGRDGKDGRDGRDLMPVVRAS